MGRFGGLDGAKRQRREAAPSPPPHNGASSQGDVTHSCVLNADLLDCNICLEVLSPPIFQCENGHIACVSCCSKLKSECPSCKRPIGSIRCLALEKLIQSLNVKCKFADQGCTQMVKFTERSVHESNCSFFPHKCPFPECIFSGRFDLFKNHVAVAHPRNWQSFDFEVKLEVELRTSDRYYVLLSTDKYFLINREVTSIGDLCYLTYPRALTYLRAPSPIDTSFRYRLEVHIKSPSTMFTMHTSCGCRKGEENRKGSAILIPGDQSMDMIVRIYRP